MHTDISKLCDQLDRDWPQWQIDMADQRDLRNAIALEPEARHKYLANCQSMILLRIVRAAISAGIVKLP